MKYQGQKKTYGVWAAMRNRCCSHMCRQFKNYGGRGIKVCARWMSFENFLADMGPKPDGLTLERKDNDGDYEPGNCKWATRAEQARNRSDNVMVEINGRSQCFYDWCIELGVNPGTARKRKYAGWSVIDALTLPKQPPRQHTAST